VSYAVQNVKFLHPSFPIYRHITVLQTLPLKIVQVYVEPHPLAVSVILPAFAAEHMRCIAAIDQYLPRAPTLSSMLLLLSINGQADGWADTQLLHRPSATYCVGSINNTTLTPFSIT